MSRTDDFDAFYRESRGRLLHQVYAYVGDTEIAQRALADAYVSASHHWRKLSGEPDKDGWMRSRAFRATGRPGNRSRKPWWLSAKNTADEHRPVLSALRSLSPTQRHLVIAYRLAHVDLATAAREVGMTDHDAQSALAEADSVLREAVYIDRVVPEPAPDDEPLTEAEQADQDSEEVQTALWFLGRDLVDEPAGRASSLRREGVRRRRYHTLLVGLAALAVAIAAGAVTAAEAPARTQVGTGDETPPQTDLEPPADPLFSTANLATETDAGLLDPDRVWVVDSTSPDFGSTETNACVTSTPSEKNTDHYWVRTFHAGTGKSPTTATQTLEISDSIAEAKAAYEQLATEYGSCGAPAHRVAAFSNIDGAGDEATMIDVQYVDASKPKSPEIATQQVAVGLSGAAVVTWVVDATKAHPVKPRNLVKTLGASINLVCDDAEGACSKKPYTVTIVTPPADPSAPQFVTTWDLPIFPELTEAWEATNPKSTGDNPAATQCDQASFDGANGLQTRSYVVPDATQLADIFGMTETIGDFGSSSAARAYVKQVGKTVSKCHNQQLSLTVKRTTDLSSDDKLAPDADGGFVWQIRQQASEDKSFTYRVGLVRVGSMVAQLTFTPTEVLDVDHDQYISLVDRTATRLAER